MTRTSQRHGEDVASAIGPVDLAFAAQVPAGAVLTVPADGEPFGHLGLHLVGLHLVSLHLDDIHVDDEDEDDRTAGYRAVPGEGCPGPALLVEQLTARRAPG